MKRVLLLLLFPLLATADPGAATQYLMNEPASLFDVGIARAQQDLEKTKAAVSSRIARQFGEEIFFIPEIRYEFDNDLLVFVFNLALSENDKAACATVS